jgi:hypothetical protein
MTLRSLEIHRPEGILTFVDQNHPKAQDDYQPVFFSRPDQAESFEEWVDRLVGALDKKGVFGGSVKKEGE